MIDFRRLMGIGAAALIVAGGLAIGQIGIASIDRQRPGWMGTDWHAWRYECLIRAGGQLSAYLKSHPRKDVPVGLILGSSSSHWIDTAMLESAGVPPGRWVLMSGAVAGPGEMQAMLRLAIDSGIRPDRVVINLELHQVARQPGYRFKIFSDRDRTRMKLYDAALALRIGFFRFIGRHARAAFAPFEPGLDRPGPSHDDDETLRRKIEEAGRMGYFDPGNYREGCEGLRLLDGLIAEARSTGADLSVVLMPSRSLLRSSIPAVAVEQIRAHAGDATIIDLSAALPDDYFSDLIHANALGLPILNARLARELESSQHRNAALDLHVGPVVGRRAGGG